ncbi:MULTISPECIES: hypothetical protein [unclassified Bartonella]|uniref:hypothetical protein n=1 Tax=unclassified Bartonella TaxID=2645622 RepID=UPI0035CF4F99
MKALVVIRVIFNVKEEPFFGGGKSIGSKIKESEKNRSENVKKRHKKTMMPSCISKKMLFKNILNILLKFLKSSDLWCCESVMSMLETK